jgi:hypothetical protein
MRSSVPCVLVAAVVACSKPSSSGSMDDAAREPYALAVAALNADHPRTLPDLDRAIGTPPVGCELGDATCVCTWRFMTKEGVKEVAAAASFADARTLEPETVLMVARDGNPLELAPDVAESGYRAGQYRASVEGRVPVSTGGGRIDTVRSEDLTKLLNSGGHLVSRRALMAAELEEEYKTWTAPQRLAACLSQPAAVRLVKLDGKTATW